MDVRPAARYVLPEFTERTSSGHRTLDPYSKLLEERIVFLGTPIDDTSANDVMAQFMYLEHQAPDRDISLYINSPGGSFSAMTAIYDTMQFVTCDVETICLGQAASAAAVLLAAGTPGKRLRAAGRPGGRSTSRRCREPVQGQAERSGHPGRGAGAGSARPLEEMLVRHTGQSPEQVAADIERDKILDAQAALDYGLVDRIVPSRKSSRRHARREVSRRWCPDLPPLPALTRAEGELIDRYLDVVDLLGRINPARRGDTYRGLRAAQALVGKAAALRDALDADAPAGRDARCTPRRWRGRCGCSTGSGARPGSPCRPSPAVDAPAPGRYAPRPPTSGHGLERTGRCTPCSA